MKIDKLFLNSGGFGPQFGRLQVSAVAGIGVGFAVEPGPMITGQDDYSDSPDTGLVEVILGPAQLRELQSLIQAALTA